MTNKDVGVIDSDRQWFVICCTDGEVITVARVDPRRRPKRKARRR